MAPCWVGREVLALQNASASLCPKLCALLEVNPGRQLSPTQPLAPFLPSSLL